jgi:hypothetical protein
MYGTSYNVFFSVYKTGEWIWFYTFISFLFHNNFFISLLNISALHVCVCVHARACVESG